MKGAGGRGYHDPFVARRLHGTDKVAVPLTSLVIFILGHGLFNTLLTVRLSAEQVSAQAIGLVSAAYFGGLVLGTFINARLIIRVGHIRAYAAYASLLCFLFLLHGMVVEPVTWAALRLIGGLPPAACSWCWSPGCWSQAPRRTGGG